MVFTHCVLSVLGWTHSLTCLSRHRGCNLHVRGRGMNTHYSLHRQSLKGLIGTLQDLVNSEQKEVAPGTVITPKSKTVHSVVMLANLAKVSMCSVFKGSDNLDPPEQPQGADEGIHYRLIQCPGWHLR